MKNQPCVQKVCLPTYKNVDIGDDDCDDADADSDDDDYNYG